VVDRLAQVFAASAHLDHRQAKPLGVHGRDVACLARLEGPSRRAAARRVQIAPLGRDHLAEFFERATRVEMRRQRRAGRGDVCGQRGHHQHFGGQLQR